MPELCPVKKRSMHPYHGCSKKACKISCNSPCRKEHYCCGQCREEHWEKHERPYQLCVSTEQWPEYFCKIMERYYHLRIKCILRQYFPSDWRHLVVIPLLAVNYLISNHSCLFNVCCIPVPVVWVNVRHVVSSLFILVECPE